MKREIKFRGLRKDGKGWAYGAFVEAKYESKSYILQFDGIESGETLFEWVEVIPETVGDFTGLKDKHGVDIYEGDNLLIPYNFIGVKPVSFAQGKFNISSYKIEVCKVIGNIHEKGVENEHTK